MNFWDTMKGLETAEIICHNLPKIAKALSAAGQQYVVTISNNSVAAELIRKELQKGSRLIAAVGNALVFEEEA